MDPYSNYRCFAAQKYNFQKWIRNIISATDSGTCYVKRGNMMDVMATI